MEKYFQLNQQFISRLVRILEIMLAFGILIGLVAYTVSSVPVLLQADWQDQQIFYDLIYQVLLLTIALELARMLVTHNFLSIIELLAFVVARKMLLPDITSLEALMGVAAFILIVAAKHYFLPNEKDHD